MPSCNKTWTDQGSFAFKFTDNPPYCPSGCTSPIDYPGKIDLHQLGLGFGGHVWFTHTEPASDVADHIVGTWTPPALNGWTRVFVHVPDSGATTRQAPYTIETGSDAETRYLNVHDDSNQWVSLGVFNFNSSAGNQYVSLTNTTLDGGGVDDIAWDSVAFQPLPSKPADIVVALGDSYSSGEGTGNYDTNSNIDGSSDTLRDACHRSPNTWSRQATLADSSTTIGSRADSYDPSMDYHLLACSGAVAKNVISVGSTLPDGSAGTNENGELPQIDQGFLDANTTLVTISIGGNDARFSGIISDCITNIVWADCQNDTLSGDSSPLSSAEPSEITNTVQPRVTTVLKDIHNAAPNAKIVLMGYPPLFSNQGSCFGNKITNNDITAYHIDTAAGLLAQIADVLSSPHITDDANWLNGIAGDLNTGLSNAAASAASSTGATIVFANPTNAFNPGGVGQAICGNPQTINDIVLPLTTGENPNNIVSQQSFHPMASGALNYAAALNSTLRTIGQ